jgi:L-iditol 2-dehydrogenase
MKALMLKEYKKLEITEVPRPEIGPADVLVQVKMCGICGSDVHGLDGSTGRRIPPLIMGHEASGVVAEVGPTVSQVRHGDRVTFDSTVYCGRCFYCRRGRVNLCENRMVLGVSCDDYRRHGAFSEYVIVPEQIIYRLPDSLNFEHATFVEALSVAMHAVNRAPMLLGETAVVVGGGMIGLLVVQLLGAAGCGNSVAVDLDNAKLTLAQNWAHTKGSPPGAATRQPNSQIATKAGRGFHH